MLAKEFGGRRQFVLRKDMQIAVGRNRWPGQAGAARPCARNDLQGFSCGQGNEKHVGILRYKAQRFEGERREVAQVPGDDHAGTRSDRRRDDMPVMGVRQMDAGYDSLVTVDQSIGDGTDHQGPGGGDLGGSDVRPVGQQIAGPLVLDLSRPACLEQSGNGELNQQVSYHRRIEDIGVKHSDRPGHSS